MLNKSINFLSISCLLLMGCQQQETTYTYLMQHPTELKAATAHCQREQTAAANCTIVMQAATDFMALLLTQEEDPEKFGQRVLEAQANERKAEAALKFAQQTRQDLMLKQANAEEITTAQKNIDLAQAAFQKQNEEVKAMLAVISLSSPE